MSRYEDFLDPARFGEAEARHLLNRLGFGGNLKQIRGLQRIGPERAVDLLLDENGAQQDRAAFEIDPDILQPVTREQQLMLREARRNDDQQAIEAFRKMRGDRRRMDRKKFMALGRWWLKRMVTTDLPALEKLTLFWHGHFTTEYQVVRDTYLMYQQNQLMREYAWGSFAELARAMVRDPAMLRYLSNHVNRKKKPNENLAREMMELFTLGEGNYSEADIKNAARALTGYHIHDNDFKFNKGAHDDASKTILGQSGTFNGDQFVDICLQQPACAQFIAMKLYRYFVAEYPTEQASEHQPAIDWLAGQLREHDYALRPTLRQMFRSAWFYEPHRRGAVIKSPVMLRIALARALNITDRDNQHAQQALQYMGQELFNPPNVAGWPGGTQWINTSTMFLRKNFTAYMIHGDRRIIGRGGKDKPWDAEAWLEQNTPADVPDMIDQLARTLLAVDLTDPQRDYLIKQVKAHAKTPNENTTTAAAILITCLPQFQVC